MNTNPIKTLAGRTWRGLAIGVAGSLGIGALVFAAPTGTADEPTQTSNTSETQAAKRDEDTPELVLVADDDDDDSNDKSTKSGDKSWSKSRETRDHTSSRFSKVSRDRDLSRGDKTRDWTKDGKGEQKRDWSANKTNDRSRNDTRG